MREAAKKRKKKDLARLPNKALYNTALAVLKLTHGNPYRLKVTKEGMEGLKPPFTVLCNHCSTIDWILAGIAMRPYYLNAVVSRYFYSIPVLRMMLRQMGAIPKDQFSPDVAAIKSMLSTAKLGGNIFLFPEGRMSPGGVSETFERSTVKLLRHLKQPVVAIHLYGAYFTHPKWSKSMRRGRIDAHVKVILTPEQMAQMTDDQVYEKMVEALKTDEYAWQKINRVKFKGRKMSEGLEDVLFLCPKCGAEHTMRASKNVIKCENCGNGASLNQYYDLIPLDDSCVIPENIGVWHSRQAEYIRRQIEEQPDISMTDTATLLLTSERRWLRPVGSGTIRLDRNGFTYSGTRDGQPFTQEIPISAIPAIAFSQGKSIEIYYQGEFYSFEPERGIECRKWAMLAEELHNIYCR